MPQFSARSKRFTQYDLMDAAGIFAANPANADAMQDGEGNSIYKGPIQYPRMMYHPRGEERILVEGQFVTDGEGNPLLRNGEPIVRGQQKELIWETVTNEEEEAALRAKGWYDHPADSIAAANDPKRPAPPKGAQAVIDQKDRRIAELEAKLRASEPAPIKPAIVVNKKMPSVTEAQL